VKVLLGGEGRTDLGDWATEEPWRASPRVVGVLETLFTRVAPESEVVGGVVWKDIRKYRSGDHAAPEVRNVLGLALRAHELGCDATVFARDRDRAAARERDIEEGITRAGTLFPQVRVAGGIAIEAIESWILSLCGANDAETMADPKGELVRRHGAETLDEKVELALSADMTRVSAHARSLTTWIERAKALVDR
jgi:hypothetical protein